MKLKHLTLILLAAISSTIQADDVNRQQRLKEEGEKILENCKRIAAQFYTLEEGEEIKEMTQAILDSQDTAQSLKQQIIASGRRFFLFQYPSDGFQVKGYISFVPNASENPLLIFLRGGNRIFGLTHPAIGFTCMRDYTILTTTYRGGVSEGTDQFGGDEVNDVQNLLEYFPILTEKLGLLLDPSKVFMLGGSRGGMEMFLALGRSPYLQSQITKAASLSGVLDIREWMLYYVDIRNMFIKDFGLIPDQNEESWIALRDPLNVVHMLKKDLPFLILQGTNDDRVNLIQGYHMVEKLQENGNSVDYIEIPGGEHCLRNCSDRVDLIADWFEKE